MRVMAMSCTSKFVFMPLGAVELTVRKVNLLVDIIYVH